MAFIGRVVLPDNSLAYPIALLTGFFRNILASKRSVFVPKTAVWHVLEFLECIIKRSGDPLKNAEHREIFENIARKLGIARRDSFLDEVIGLLRTISDGHDYPFSPKEKRLMKKSLPFLEELQLQAHSSAYGKISCMD